jgi:hypothetical protein
MDFLPCRTQINGHDHQRCSQGVRRKPPDAVSITVAAIHYHLAINHLGVGTWYDRWLCGASFKEIGTVM